MFTLSTSEPTPQILDPLWSVQVYVTSGATATSDPNIPLKLRDIISSAVLNFLEPFRVDTYFLPGEDRDACMAHYRLEKVARAGTPFDIVPRYSDSYCSTFVIIDCRDWENAKARLTQFDPPEELRRDLDHQPYLLYDTTDTRIRMTREPEPLAPLAPGSQWTSERSLQEVIRDHTCTGDFADRRQR
ncbi:hypothetical protein K431DRAFT_11577 [Polychaeton citri CBS 116435]|uniref:Uncharacterized protein n=1 Tax=Polychaeton citri CBS 116435 TaxID=1314669 RepID=A0A9P4UL80_9PEZI|nr:hypothetical protein K431DRAFT_11577 [Polychaeton citri CBS 116435]